MPSYVMVSVHSGVPWPIEETDVNFAGREIRLIPPTFEPNGRVRLDQ